MSKKPFFVSELYPEGLKGFVRVCPAPTELAEVTCTEFAEVWCGVLKNKK